MNNWWWGGGAAATGGYDNRVRLSIGNGDWFESTSGTRFLWISFTRSGYSNYWDTGDIVRIKNSAGTVVEGLTIESWYSNKDLGQYGIGMDFLWDYFDYADNDDINELWARTYVNGTLAQVKTYSVETININGATYIDTP